MLTGHNGATQVDGSEVIECILGDLVKRRVPASDAHADIVVEDIDASPTSPCSLDHRRQSGLVGNVRFEGQTFATRLSCHCDRMRNERKTTLISGNGRQMSRSTTPPPPFSRQSGL